MIKENFQQTQDFDFTFLRNKIERVSVSIGGVLGATATACGVFYTVTASCTVEEIWESHSVAGTDGNPVSLDIEKLASGVALDSGVSILPSVYDMKSTANIPIRKTPTTTMANRQLARGDRLALKNVGDWTGVAGLSVTLIIKYKL
jgi:hypothetical protein